MPKYKLTYFNIRGLAEPIRYILSYMGEDFEDVRIPREDWPTIKNTMPFGKLPILEIDGKTYNDSAAICRFLGNKAGLGGNTPLENLVIDQVAGALGDLRNELAKVVAEPDEAIKEKTRQTIVNEIIPFYFSRIEKMLEQNGGHFANGKLSWVDMYMVGFCESVPSILQVNILDKYPKLKSLTEKVQALPGIKDWIARRPESLY